MIRMFIGFLLVFGAVGGLDNDPDASIFVLTSIAIMGLAFMAWGVKGIKQY